jgi:hypothetical protein
MCKRSGSSSGSSSSSSESGDTRLLFARLAGRDLYFLGSQVSTATAVVANILLSLTVNHANLLTTGAAALVLRHTAGSNIAAASKAS